MKISTTLWPVELFKGTDHPKGQRFLGVREANTEWGACLKREAVGSWPRFVGCWLILVPVSCWSDRSGNSFASVAWHYFSNLLFLSPCWQFKIFLCWQRLCQQQLWKHVGCWHRDSVGPGAWWKKEGTANSSHLCFSCITASAMFDPCVRILDAIITALIWH